MKKPTATPFTTEWFIQLLIRQKEGLTTRAEDRYICREIKTNPEAAVLQTEVDAVYPPKRFRISSCQRPWLRVAAIFCIIMTLAAGIYALNVFYEIIIRPREEKVTITFQRTSLSEVAEAIERKYKVKVIFDREELRDRVYNGKIDKNASKEEVLNDLQFINVEYSIDENGDVHLK